MFVPRIIRQFTVLPLKFTFDEEVIIDHFKCWNFRDLRTKTW